MTFCYNSDHFCLISLFKKKYKWNRKSQKNKQTKKMSVCLFRQLIILKGESGSGLFDAACLDAARWTSEWTRPEENPLVSNGRGGTVTVHVFSTNIDPLTNLLAAMSRENTTRSLDSIDLAALRVSRRLLSCFFLTKCLSKHWRMWWVLLET